MSRVARILHKIVMAAYCPYRRHKEESEKQKEHIARVSFSSKGGFAIVLRMEEEPGVPATMFSATASLSEN